MICSSGQHTVTLHTRAVENDRTHLPYNWMSTSSRRALMPYYQRLYATLPARCGRPLNESNSNEPETQSGAVCSPLFTHRHPTATALRLRLPTAPDSTHKQEGRLLCTQGVLLVVLKLLICSSWFCMKQRHLVCQAHVEQVFRSSKLLGLTCRCPTGHQGTSQHKSTRQVN